MKIISVTCARLKSTRMHQKCIRKLNGSPLLRYTVNFAKALGYSYYIFTLDEGIRNIVTDCSVIQEPTDLYDVPGNILNKLIYINNILNADIIILLQATSPVRSLILYKHWIDDFIHSSFEVGFSVYKKDRKNYEMNGAFYIIRKSVLKKENKDIIVNNAKMYLDYQNIDIDTEQDFKKAEEYFVNEFYNRY